MKRERAGSDCIAPALRTSRLPDFPSSRLLTGLRGPLDGDPGDRRSLGGLGARDRTGLGVEAALERALDLRLDEVGLFARHCGNLGNDEELRAVEHALFAEREVLGTGEEGQALEDFDDVVDRAGPHPVRIVLEAPLPVLVIVDL